MLKKYSLLQTQLKSWLGDESKAVFVPAPLSKSYLAEAPPPDQVEGVMAEVDGTENSDPYITLSIKVEWEKVESDIAYYLLRVVWDNTTGPASSIYHHQLVRHFATKITTNTFPSIVKYSNSCGILQNNSAKLCFQELLVTWYLLTRCPCQWHRSLLHFEHEIILEGKILPKFVNSLN